MATNVSFTRGPAYRIMAQAIKDGQLLIATDSRQLFIDQDSARIEITDILVVDKLPENNVIVNKLYYVDNDNILAIFNGTQWIQINAQQLITTGNKKGTISVGGVDIPVNGLGTAAYASKDDFDPAGAAGAMIGSTDDSVDAHTILGIRNRVDKAVKDMDSKLGVEVTRLDTKIDNSVSTLNTKIDESVSTINTNVENQFEVINQTLTEEITNINNSVDEKIDNINTSIDNKLSTVNQYTIQKLAETDENAVATYSLYKDGNPIGEKINIPKDYLVRYAELKICKKRNNPPGFETGDQYIDFVINSAEEDGNESHIYLNVNDLVDVYEAGDGINVDHNNIISINITPGNGLDFDNDKLRVNEVTTEANGAMLATDKVKLDGIETGAQVNKVYTIIKQRQPNLGYTATYVLYEDNTIVGDPINIPEDYVISNIAFAIGNGRVGRIEAGRPYLDITVQNYLQTSNEIHIYCELPMPGNGIDIDENSIKVILKEENGIYFNDIGEIALDLVTQTTNGAMSAEDKTKLDGIESGSQVNIIESASLNGVVGTIDENKNIDLTFSVNDSGLSLGEDNEIGLKLVPGNGLEFNSTGQFGMQLVNSSKKTHGAMSFNDKSKLDGIEDGSQVNIIEHIALNGVETPVNSETKTVDIPLTVNDQGLSIGESNEIGLKLVPGNGLEFNSVGQFGLQTANVEKSRNGAMTFNEKDKLDKIEDTAQVNIIESTSLNGVAAVIDSNKNANLTFSVSDQGLSLGSDNEIGLKLVPGNGLEYNSTGQFGLQLVNDSTRNGAMSATDKKKLDGIEEGSQVNDIEHIMLNGVEAPLDTTTKTVDIPLTVSNEGLSIGANNELGLKLVPGNGLEYNVDGQFALQIADVAKTRNGAITYGEKDKLAKIEDGSQVNIIESASLNGVAGTIDDNKNIDLIFSVNNQGLSLGDNNEIGLRLVPGNGLAFNSDGQFALSLATPTREGQAATNGAVSGADKTKIMGQMDINAIAHPFQILSDTDATLTGVDKAYAPDITTGAVKLVSNHVLTMPASEGISTTGTDGYMTAAYAKKLEGIEAGAQVNIIESIQVGNTNATIANKKATIPLSVNDSGLALGANNEISFKYVPGNGLAMNTSGQLGLSIATQSDNGAMSSGDKTKVDNLQSIYSISAPLSLSNDTLSIAPATASANGYMTSTYASKLDGIEAGAQVNKIETITVGNTAATITNKNATIPLSVNTTGLSLGANNEISFKYVAGNGLAMNDKGSLGMSVVTASDNGAMISTDKTKLDNLKSIYTVSAPLSFSGTTLSLPAATTTTAGHMSAGDKTKLDSLKSIYTVSAPLSFSGTTLSIPAATTSANGYMTSTQATKLNGIATGAEVNKIDSITFAGKAVSITNKQAAIPFSVKQECLSLGDNNELSFLYTPGNGLAINSDHSLGMELATTSTNGAMSSGDKTKLNSIKDIRTVSSPLTFSGTTLGIQVATSSQNGYMSASDKSKLDDLSGSSLKKYSTVIGNGSATTFTITHNLKQPHVVVSGFNNQGYGVWLEYQIISESQIKVMFDTAPSTNSITVVVVG